MIPHLFPDTVSNLNSGGISKLDDLRAIKELAEIGVDSAILGKSLYARAFTLQEALEVAK